MEVRLVTAIIVFELPPHLPLKGSKETVLHRDHVASTSG